MKVTSKTPAGMSVKTLIPFLTLTFGVSWGLVALYMLFTEPLVAIFGEIGYTNPLFILAVYTPGFAAVFLIWWYYGLRGLGSFFRRLTLWRAPASWWLLLILGIPVIFYAGAAVKGSFSAPFPFSSWYQLFPALALALLLGPIEEFGWRGVALPLLQRRFAPFWASLILGLIWGAWHLPAFFLEGTPQSAWSFGPYFIGVVAIAIILTPMFNAARGSLLVAALYHFQLNNPIWPDAQPWDMLMFAVAAVFVVWLNRRQMFQREAGVTEVLMPQGKDIPSEQRYDQRKVAV